MSPDLGNRQKKVKLRVDWHLTLVSPRRQVCFVHGGDFQDARQVLTPAISVQDGARDAWAYPLLL